MRIAINGFGRIGRLFFRRAFNLPEFDIVAINDLGDLENLAYLLKYDTVYGRYERQISNNKSQTPNKLIIDGKEILVFQEKDLAGLPWKDLEIDVVVESTGAFESFEQAKKHLDAGAKRVLLTAPSKDSEDTAGGKTIFIGVNEGELKKTILTSNASCTTNAVYPVIAVLSEKMGIKKAILNTVHAYTNTQTIVDAPVKGNDFRRGRAGAQNIIPSTTGAATAVTRVIKELENKFDGIALRVPIVTGSIADITFISQRKTSVEEINGILKEAEKLSQWQGILKTTEQQIVSSDIIGEPHSAVVDLSFTRVVDGDLVKVLVWYDNEWGYVSILIKHILEIAKSL